VNSHQDTPDRPSALWDGGWAVRSVQFVAASGEWTGGTTGCQVCGRPVALAGAHVGIQLLRVSDPSADGDRDGVGSRGRAPVKSGVEYCRVVCSRARATRRVGADESVDN
jgi:hypothetical protein